MIIPTPEEIAKAYEAIHQRGPEAAETTELALLTNRNEKLRGTVEAQTKAIAKLLGVPADDAFVVGLLCGVFITGLNIGLTAAEVRFNQA